MPNQRTSKAKSVPKGTAPEDFSPQMNKFKIKNMLKAIPGKKSAVYSVFFRHSVNLNILYVRVE